MSTSIGNLAVYLSADTGQADKKIAGFGASVDRLDKKMKGVGDTTPKMRGLTAAGERSKRVAEAAGRGDVIGRHRGADAIGQARSRAGGGAGQVVGGKASGMLGAGEILGAAEAGGPWAAAGVAALTALAAAGAGVKKALDLAGVAEANRAAFDTLLGSAEKGQAMMAALDAYAAKTAFSSVETAELGKQLLGVGVEADQVMPALRTFGDIAGTLGGNTTERMQRLVKAFGDVKASGRLSAEELNQFSEAGVNLGDALAKTMGKPREQIKKLAAEGEIGFGEVAKALNSLVGPGGQFHGGADKFAATWGGMLGQVGDATDRVFRQMGTALIEDLKLKDVMGEGLRVAEQLPDVIGGMRPGLRFLGDHLKVGVKHLGDMLVIGSKLTRIMGAAGKAFFAPEMKQFADALGRYKDLLGDLERQDLQGMFHRAFAGGLDALEPFALGVAGTVDDVIGWADKIKAAWDGVGEGATKAFGVVADAIRLAMAPLDVTIAKLKVFQDLLKGEKNLKDLNFDTEIAGAVDALKKAGDKLGGGEPKKAIDPKGDFDWAAERRRQGVGPKLPKTATDRVRDMIDAARGVNTAMARDHAIDQLGQAFGPLAAELRQSVPYLDLLGRQLDKLTGNVDAFGGALSEGQKKLSAGLREEAQKLTDQYADPLAKLFKRADELDKMKQFGAIDEATSGLAFNAEAEKVLRLRAGERNRPAPAVEYGTRDFNQLVQQATGGGGQKNLLSAVQDLRADQKEEVRLANEMLAELRRIPRPKIIKMGG